MFGYSFGISDVRVTLRDGVEVDCLRKIHNVGRFIAAGFAGSVKIGFAMVDELASLLYVSDESRAWEPDMVAQWWPNDACEIFSKFPPEEKASHSHLMRSLLTLSRTAAIRRGHVRTSTFSDLPTFVQS